MAYLRRFHRLCIEPDLSKFRRVLRKVVMGIDHKCSVVFVSFIRGWIQGSVVINWYGGLHSCFVGTSRRRFQSISHRMESPLLWLDQRRFCHIQLPKAHRSNTKPIINPTNDVRIKICNGHIIGTILFSCWVFSRTCRYQRVPM